MTGPDFRLVQRIEDVPEQSYQTQCVVCRLPIILHFNGGDLDCTYHCGYRYQLESRGIDFAVYKRSP